MGFTAAFGSGATFGFGTLVDGCFGETGLAVDDLATVGTFTTSIGMTLLECFIDATVKP